MDTVCIRASFQQEEAREIILRTHMVTEFFPARHRRDDYFGSARPDAGHRPRSIPAGLAHARVTAPADTGQVRPSRRPDPPRRHGFIAVRGH